MSLNVNSTIEDIAEFLKPFNNSSKYIPKFKEEKIKGNEIFYLDKEDFKKLNCSLPIKIINKLKEMKKDNENLLKFNFIINENSSIQEIQKFLKEEIKLEETIIEKLKEYDFHKFINLTIEEMFEIGLKLGERKKLYKYLENIKQNIKASTTTDLPIDITNTSTFEEVCLFLAKRFKIPEKVLTEIRDNQISGKELLNYNEEDIIDLGLNKEDDKEIIEQILKYIKKENNLEDEEEAIFKCYQLIEINDYFTSEEEKNKCLFNVREEFIKLCDDMNIDTKDNCSEIDFDQAKKIKLKSVTLWGTKEGLYEFFDNKKMYNITNYFKNGDTKLNSGIFLLIKEDKSFAYIVIWPGKMSYFYTKFDEPQKDLLLSLVRIGFSLSDNNVICLTEKQQNEFDFQSIKEFNYEGSYTPTVGKVEFNRNGDDYFKIDKDIEIKLNLDEKNKNIKIIQTNKSSVFISYQEEENINRQIFSNVPSYNINFNEENVIFDKEINLPPFELYTFMQKFQCFKEKLNQKDIFFSNFNQNIFNDRINQIKEFYTNIFIEFLLKKNKSKSKLQCEICENNSKSECLVFVCKRHYSVNEIISHSNKGQKSKYYLLIDYENISEEISALKNILNKLDCKLINNIIEEFSKNQNNYDKKNYLDKLAELYTTILQNLDTNKNKILNEDQISTQYKKESLEWKRNIINEIENNFYKKLDKKKVSYVIFKKAKYDKNIKNLLFTYEKYSPIHSKNIVKLFTFYPKYNESKYYLEDTRDYEWNEYLFENFYVNEKLNGILVKKGENDYIVHLKNKDIHFNGCYDYDKNNEILILSRFEKIYKNSVKILEQKINIYYLEQGNKIKYSKNFNLLKFEDKLIKIMIVPYNFDNSSKYVLFLTKKLISLINIKDCITKSELNILHKYGEYKKELFQFLIYEKFFLIFYFIDKEKIWKYDIYIISPYKENAFFIPQNKENNFFNIPKDSTFCICKIKNEIILYYYYIENNKIYINSKKVITSLTSFNISNSVQNKNNELKFSEGNCVINYFYHCFIKFPSFGSLQYHYYNKKVKKYTSIFPNKLSDEDNYRQYFNKLKEMCKNERGLDDNDLDYEFKGLFTNKKIINDTDLGNIIIKFIEVVPIQVAKIKNHYFKAMSNGKDISNKELYELHLNNKKDKKVKLSIQEYANFINFDMKNSILNYYDLPVIVLVFMGSQSVGKSTLSNELVQSFFNVSGMRCTEGIWMSIALFIGKEINNKICGKLCKICKSNKCRLKTHDIEFICICDTCCCNKRCYLSIGEANIKKGQNYCHTRCALPKDHIKNDKNEHLCEISPYYHGLICISLDFEGLGTFERSTEQDIDLAMVGAALGNCILLRADKTFDKYMESRMFNWSEGSKNIKVINNDHYFGGNIIFCQKDIPKSNVEEVKNEFDSKITQSINKWVENEKKRNLKVLNLEEFPVFGIFSNYINCPTPIFNKKEFHNMLRTEMINLIIKDTLIKKSLPKYKTGKQFMFFLKGILAAVDIHDYNVLDSIAIDNLKKYLYDNMSKAIEIFGIYSLDDDIENFEDLEIRAKENLEILKSSYISNSNQEIEEILITYININSSDLKMVKEYENLKIELSKIEESDNINNINFTHKLIIKGIPEYGLLLFIPLTYKHKFSLNHIREKLFIYWKNICNKINLKDIEINNNFEHFINAIIHRREINVKKWVNNLTSSFSDKSLDSVKQFDSLKEKWILCQEICTSCYFKCTKLLGHLNEHECEFDHVCHEKCDYCTIIKCKDFENCSHYCENKKAGHKEKHKCSHFHPCQNKCFYIILRGCTEICKLECDHEENCNCKNIHLCDKFCTYKNFSLDCKIKCNLEINHHGEHKCENKLHKCNQICNLKNISRGCINDGICNYKLPHAEGNHNCGGDHKCNKNCSLKDVSKGCNKICNRPYNHNGDCLCGEIHKCKEICQLNGKIKKCNNECCLDYGHYDNKDHKKWHRCKNEIHYCLNYCFYMDKSRNCSEDKKCILLFDHDGNCKCNTNEHLCISLCSKKNCKKFCNLPYEHKEILHNCKSFHKCNNHCFLKEYSMENTCKGICSLELDHDGDCICIISKEKHICKKNCSSENCKAKCSLIAGHKELCYCGKCSCPEECKYKNNSRNCKEKCKGNYGHNGEHICEEKIHLCNEKCCYKDKTRENGGCRGECSLPLGHSEKMHFCETPKEEHICKGECAYKEECIDKTCNIACHKPIDHENPCICKNLPQEHICKKECYLNNLNLKGCNSICSLPVRHKGKCICSVKEKGHLCGKICFYSKNTRLGCKLKCTLPFKHCEDKKCKCSSSLEEHICNGECHLKSNTREGCNSLCSLNLSKNHICICNIPKDKHICNKPCSLRDKSLQGSCNNICNKIVNHNGDCICSSKKHECNKYCKYKDICRAGCLEKCSKEAGHKDEDHVCLKEPKAHKCKEICNLNQDSREGCQVYCDKEPNHIGIHLCASEQKSHKCNKHCILSKKCRKGCNILCGQYTGGHGEEHHCLSKEHICPGKCHLLSKSRGCQSNCILLYGHKDKCMCIKDKNHYCMKICELCKDYCNYKYNHKNKVHHLCKKPHDCKEECNQDGICEINTERNINIRNSMISIKLKSNEQVIYLQETEQTFNKKKCTLKIPAEEISHKGKHRCQNDKHKCGEKCKQCNRLCELEFGHQSSHYCLHGHIINSSFKAEESFKNKINDNYYTISDEDPACMYSCYQYCKEIKRFQKMNWKKII